MSNLENLDIDEPSGLPHFLSIRQVCKLSGFSKAWIYRLIQQGRFPKPVRLGGSHRVGVLAAEYKQWAESLIAERDAA